MSESSNLQSWPESIAAARIPANNNVRLLQALLLNPAISATTAAQPGSPAEMDTYILPTSPTGAQWDGFNEDDVVIFYNATWTAYAPPQGLLKYVEDEGEEWQFVGSSSGGWVPFSAGGGGTITSVNGQTGPAVVLEAVDIDYDNTVSGLTATETQAAIDEIVATMPSGGGSSPISIISGTTYTGAAADDGNTMVFTNTSAKSATIDPDATTALPADWELILNNKGANNLTVIAGSGVTITAPAGGTLVIPSGGTAALKRVAADDFFLAGNTL
jgi:hypothetical protein